MPSTPFITRRPHPISQPGVSLAAVRDKFAQVAAATAAAGGGGSGGGGGGSEPPPPPPPPPPPALLPYLMDFNYPSKAAMLAAYAADGIIVDPLVDGTTSTAGALVLQTAYGIATSSTNIPLAPYNSAPDSPYIYINAVGQTYPFRFNIAIPAARQFVQVQRQYWRFSSARNFMTLTYDDGSTAIEGDITAGSPTPFRNLAAFPAVPPAGKYIVKITFTVENVDRFAIDNIWLYP